MALPLLHTATGRARLEFHAKKQVYARDRLSSVTGLG